MLLEGETAYDTDPTCWVDENINATLPCINEASFERMFTRMIQVHNLIKTHMVHKLFKGDGGCLHEKTIRKNVIQDRTSHDDHGCRQYKRKTGDDLNIVPHNAVNILLLHWNGRANVEYSGSLYCLI